MKTELLMEKWEKPCREFLVGKTIKEVRYLSQKEMEDLGWYHSTLVIFFEDGNYIFASADDEGNDAGALFTSSDDLPTIPVI